MDFTVCTYINNKLYFQCDDEIQYLTSLLLLVDEDPRPPPIIHQGPQNQTLPVNSLALLPCLATGNPAPSIRWYKNYKELQMRDPRFALLDSGTLQIAGFRDFWLYRTFNLTVLDLRQRITVCFTFPCISCFYLHQEVLWSVVFVGWLFCTLVCLLVY